MSTSAGALTRSIAIALRSELRFKYSTVSAMKASCLWRKPSVLPMVCGAYRRVLPMAFCTRARSDGSQPEAPAMSPSGSKASSMDDLDDDFDFKPPFLNPFLVKGMNKAFDGEMRFKGPNEDGHYKLSIPLKPLYEKAGINCDDLPWLDNDSGSEGEDSDSDSDSGWEDGEN